MTIFEIGSRWWKLTVRCPWVRVHFFRWESLSLTSCYWSM